MCELSKCIDGSIEACNKEMHRMSKYFLDTKDMGLKLWPTGVMGQPWYQISLSNLPNKYYGRTMMCSFYFCRGRATTVAMRQL